MLLATIKTTGNKFGKNFLSGRVGHSILAIRIVIRCAPQSLEQQIACDEYRDSPVVDECNEQYIVRLSGGTSFLGVEREIRKEDNAETQVELLQMEQRSTIHVLQGRGVGARYRW